MMKSRNPVAALLAIGALVAVLSACERKQAQTEEKGVAETAGQQIDQAAARAGEELNKAVDKVGEAMQDAGRKLQNEADEAQKKE